ncbi:GNAT family N-acetyltransferase [Acinetobacter boissieri]|uniref:Ribosomal-protein-alanine N-acetyltransferase n=1 Tax=Acinetobacter boissieri TaxID=1219383 RepID=A0A1G6GHG6_9GAMM|nr:GNAT family protein [Acinetobacter boissieri]SDB81283.1 ribosomal-protein-alanine N-acetyltransferase [Acinetobacter boissieri]
MHIFPTLSTDRLVLRELTVEDIPNLRAIHSDVHHMRWFGVDPVVNLSQAENLFQIFQSTFSTGVGVRWAIERRSDNAFLGTCGLFKWNKAWHSCAIGYELASFAQGHGYMREALSTAISYGFNTMKLNRIEAQVHTDNIRSITTLNTLGFICEGLQRQAGYWHNNYHDLYQLSLIRLDYDA